MNPDEVKFKSIEPNKNNTARLLAYCTVEEARDMLIGWAEKGVPLGTTFETLFAVIIKSVAWLCIQQVQRDERKKTRYGR
jgi:hypothetical protein